MAKKTNTVTFALCIMCIILAAGLIAVTAYYNNRPNTGQLISADDEITRLKAAIADYEKQIDILTFNNTQYKQIVNLEKTDTLIGDIPYTQSAGELTVVFNEKFTYAGYLEVKISSTSDTTYAQVSYTYNNLKYDETTTVGTKGTAYFPIMPGTVKITIGNTDTGTATINTDVTVNYIY